MTENSNLEAALKYHSKGFSVIPMYAIVRGKNEISKKPHLDEWKSYQEKRPDEAQIKEWWVKYPNALIGVICGAISGIIGSDTDSFKADEEFQSLLPESLPVPVCRSPRKGKHYIFKYQEGIKSSNSTHSFEIKSDGNILILPPGTLSDGRHYEWLEGCSIDDIEPPEIPPALLEKIKSNGTEAVEHKPEGWEKEYLQVSKGERNSALTKLAGRYVGRGLSQEEVLPLLTNINLQYDPPLPEREVISILDSILKTHRRNNPKRESKPQTREPLPGEIESESLLSFNLTDSGNAECFHTRNKDSYVFVEEENEWRRTENGKWINADREVLIEMRDTMREKGRQAIEFIDDPEKIKPIVKHSLGSESNQKISAALNISKSMMYVSNKVFDADPYVFGCANGAINLRTGELFRPTRENWIHKSSPVEYHPDEPCPMWLNHLNKVTGGSDSLIGFLRRWFGYCLTGSIDERCLAIFHGKGANGKTITVETISFIMGEYAKRTRTETILVKHEAGASNDIADLVGARFVYSSEAEQDKRLAESLVKDLTGGDSISTRKLYQEYFTFKPQFKMILSTNHKPVIYGTDQAIWDRIKLVPFNVTIPEEEQRPIHEMMGMFQDEAPGILAWMVQGCLEWLEKGLQAPEEVKAATKQYRSDMDVLQDFLDDCCNLQDGKTTVCKDLYLRFKSWGESEGLREKEIWSKSTLTRRFKERGFKQTQEGTDRIRVWKGISLKS